MILSFITEQVEPLSYIALIVYLLFAITLMLINGLGVGFSGLFSLNSLHFRVPFHDYLVLLG